MGGRRVIPVGPQHPVLPEPIQLQVVLEDEKVVEAIPGLGYVHRGLEKLVKVKDFNQMIYVAERVCGICSFQHALTYCQGIEEIMNLEVPDRARFLRVIWAELSRLASHTLWLGLAVEALGFESLFMLTWKTREKIMDMLDATAGGRVIISTCIIGGVRRDIDDELCRYLLTTLDEVEKELKQIEKVFLTDYTVKKRTVGLGVLTRDQAVQLGAVGPMLRASGVAQDVRMTGYAAYKEVGFEPIFENDGDSFARLVVRYKETIASLELVRRAIRMMPEGDINVKVTGRPNGESFTRVEQPRGELTYYIKANGTPNLERMHIRTPSFANVPPLLAMLPGCQLSDVPMVILTIDPCISCTER